jgi:hypothetical protein
MLRCARHTREPAVAWCVTARFPGVSRLLNRSCRVGRAHSASLRCLQTATRALTLQKESAEPKTQQRTGLLGAHGEPSPRLEDFKVLVHLIRVRVLLRAQAQDRLSLGRECDLASLEMRVVR